MPRIRTLLVTVFIVAAIGCGDGSGPGQPPASCDVEPTSLAPGQLAVTDASETACVRLPAAGTSGAEYLYLAYSAAPEETEEGTAGEYQLSGNAGTPPPAAVRANVPGAPRATEARRLHDRLRVVGRDMARRRPGVRAGSRVEPAAVQTPPVLGEQRSFNLLRDATAPGTDPADFVQVQATARYVDTTVAIFLDDAAPTDGGYTQADLDAIGRLFHDHLHPIAVNAYADETDVNDDGVVLVLLSDRVTRLGGCDGISVVVGYFFAVDLFEDMVGSNNAEIFYGLAPDLACGIDRADAARRLPGVFIHEFQHMINYGQHVIVRDGDAEDVWLDEGLSVFAEELGGRLVPDDRCVENDCLTQFQLDNLTNAYSYLAALPDAYLIGPRQPPLPLTQYGADWLFVRWLADHFAETQPLGTDLTRALVQTTQTGSANVVSATGTPFDRLVGEWQLANFLEDHPDFLDISAGTHFEYASWNLRNAFSSLNFEHPYPLQTDAFDGDPYSRTDALRAGSGQHLLVEPGDDGAIVDLKLTRSDGETPLPSGLVPRTAVLRLR